jgi:hypothetical protein
MLPAQSLSSTLKLAFYSIAIISLIFEVAGCRQQSKPDRMANPVEDGGAPAPTEESSTLVPVVDLDAEDR